MNIVTQDGTELPSLVKNTTTNQRKVWFIENSKKMKS